MTFQKKLEKIQKKNNSLVCVGLDPGLQKIPRHLKKRADPIFEFNKAIIEATHDLVCTYKPNIAFYEAEGIKGLRSLKKTIDLLHKNYPEIPLLLDAKRADIGSTNLGYIKAIFDYFNFDAVTVHPYLGQKAVQPFLEKKDKGIIVLCRTSNPGAGEFQDLVVDHPEFGKLPLYKIVAHQVAKYWNKNNNCGLVVGATYPKELVGVRKIVGKMFFLIPGVGAQGGDIKKTVKAAEGGMFIISSSRGIIYASNRKDFAQKAREETKKLKNLINLYRESR